jgi:alanyl aminopeptidase
LTECSRVLAVLVWLVVATACAPEPQGVAGGAEGPSDEETIPEGQLPDGVVPESCHLALEILPDARQFSGRVEIAVQVGESLDRFYIHGQGLRVSDTALVLPGGERVSAAYEQVHPDGIARVILSREVGPGEAVLEIVFSGEFADRYPGLFRVEQGDDAYVFSDFQPIQARQAFPGFDEPRFKIPYQIELTTRSELTALSNGEVAGEEELGNGLKRVRFSTTRPLPAYLVAFAVGPLDIVEGPPIPANDWRPDPLPLRGVATRGNGPGLEYALANTGVMVDAMEAYFELAYPYSKLDLVAVPAYWGAMENAGLVFYAEDLLLLGGHPSFRQIEDFGATHAHELAHQWLGDLVTMAWWDDLWLSEASADWMTGKIMAIWRPDLHYDRTQQSSVYSAMEEDSLTSARRVREPVSDAAGMFAAFNNLTYVKGAAILGMLESYVGEEVFREAWSSYLRARQDGTATVFDFIESLDQAAGEDKLAGDIFRSFLFQAGVPEITATVRCAPDSAVVSLRQNRYLPLGSDEEATERWAVPVCMRWDHDGAEGGAGSCLVMSEASQELSLGPECPGWIMPNRGASGYYRWAVGPAEYMPVDGAGRFLTDREGMSLADSLAARVNGGEIGAGEYLAVVPDIAAALERSVSLAPLAQVRRMLDYLVGPDDEVLARAYLGAIYQRRLEFLDRPGGGEPAPERERFRSGLISFLAEEVRDPTVREQLAAQATAYTGYREDGRLHEEAVPADLVRTALTIGVQDLGPEFFDHLLGMLDRETSGAARRDLLFAVGSPEQPLLLARSRNLLLDDRLRDNEVTFFLWRLTRPQRAVGTWDWFKGNHAAVMDRLPEGWRSNTPLYFTALCDIGHADELQHIFEHYERSMPGIAAHLQQAREQIAVCEAYRARHTAEVRDFFQALRGGEEPPGGAGFAAGNTGD